MYLAMAHARIRMTLANPDSFAQAAAILQAGRAMAHLGKPVRRTSLRLELGIPIEIVEPALMQVVRRKEPSIAMQLMHGGAVRP